MKQRKVTDFEKKLGEIAIQMKHCQHVVAQYMEEDSYTKAWLLCEGISVNLWNLVAATITQNKEQRDDLKGALTDQLKLFFEIHDGTWYEIKEKKKKGTH